MVHHDRGPGIEQRKGVRGGKEDIGVPRPGRQKACFPVRVRTLGAADGRLEPIEWKEDVFLVEGNLRIEGHAFEPGRPSDSTHPERTRGIALCR